MARRGVRRSEGLLLAWKANVLQKKSLHPGSPRSMAAASYSDLGVSGHLKSTENALNEPNRAASTGVTNV